MPMIAIDPMGGELKSVMPIGMLYGGVLATATLIILLAYKEVASASEIYDTVCENAFNSPISTLLIVFAMIVILKTLEILYP